MQVEINGVSMAYSVIGESGPWVIMSHSLGCDQRMWDHQLDALAGRYRVLRYDTRGHGASGATPAPYSLDLLADDALKLMDHVGADRAHWVGFSMGGMIGQVFALKHGERLRSLVLADTTSAHTATPASMWAERIRTAREGGIAPLVAPAIGRWFTERFRTDEPEETERIAQMIRATSVDGWCGCCAAIAEVHTTERLGEIQCPVLVMVGEHDIGTPLSAALDIHRHLQDSVLAVVSDAAHMSCVEQPAQFNRALRLFLDTHSDPA
ncbi:3-oxoadipate enol-lactonase [Denitromonas iodatirespirans]|uniref:3-oxoadipate enol-lactonase n=1 Tax=Denitromonas iodatirespirans TaxID=2795389 RepID=A0A944H7X9_DENI1|nr:3-oxoadipate enol-lactonase [Denitromonas iodatirespirans]MBT0961644.1 3-oxoadipate enol-lactonase [Denitromonas iodatirespirans]